VEERIALMRAYESGAFTVAALAASYGVSRETVYQWKRGREAGDERSFEEQSRTPGRCPHATPPDVIAANVAMRERSPRFGPKKINARLALDRPDLIWPAVSTIGDILKREGLIVPRPARRKPLDRGNVVAGSDIAHRATRTSRSHRAQNPQQADPHRDVRSPQIGLLLPRSNPITSICGVQLRLDESSGAGQCDRTTADAGQPHGSIGSGSEDFIGSLARQNSLQKRSVREQNAKRLRCPQDRSYTAQAELFAVGPIPEFGSNCDCRQPKDKHVEWLCLTSVQSTDRTRFQRVPIIDA